MCILLFYFLQHIFSCMSTFCRFRQVFEVSLSRILTFSQKLLTLRITFMSSNAYKELSPHSIFSMNLNIFLSSTLINERNYDALKRTSDIHFCWLLAQRGNQSICWVDHSKCWAHDLSQLFKCVYHLCTKLFSTGFKILRLVMYFLS